MKQFHSEPNVRPRAATATRLSLITAIESPRVLDTVAVVIAARFPEAR